MYGDPHARPGSDDAPTPRPDSIAESDTSQFVADADNRDERINSLIERAASSPDVQERIRCFLDAAQIYANEMGEHDKALITLQAALSEDYSNDKAADALMRLGDQLGRRQELIEEFSQGVGEVSDLAQRIALLLLLARWQEELGDTKAAGAKISKALGIDATSMPAIRAQTAFLTLREDWEGLGEHLSKSGAAVRRTADRVELILAAADLYRNRLKKAGKAADLYSQAMALDPEAPAALEALAEIAWQDENWVKVLPLLERLTEASDRPAAERSRTLQRAALTALRLGEDSKARGHALALANLSTPASDFLGDWLDIAVSRQWWSDVITIGAYLRQQPDFKQPVSEQAELAARIGRAHIEAGDLEAASAEFEAAVRLDPNHRRAREQLADVRTQLGDASGAMAHKRRLAEGVAAPDERFRLLLEMARSERDSLKNPEAALTLFEEARELNPDDRSILAEMLDLYSERKKWLPASEVLLSLAEHAEPPSRARYLVAAANILHYELGESEHALEVYDKALDDDPTDLKTFDRQDKILSARSDFKEQARAYRRMIKRVGAATDDQKKATLLTLWRGLADLLNSKLSDQASATTAYEVCVQLDPDSLSDREALAELSELSGPDGIRPAVEHRTELLEKSDDGAALVRQLQALRRLYSAAGVWDRVYNVCAALTVLQAADPEERGFYDQVAAGSLAMPQAALTEEVWQKIIYAPAEERRLSLLFSCVAPVVALARSQEPKAFGLKDRLRLDPGSDPSGVARLFEFGAGVLTVAPPSVYLNPEFVGEVEVINLRDSMTTNVMVSPSIVQGRVEKDVAFVVGRTLALTRADHLVLSRHIVPSVAELTAIVHAAFKLCHQGAPVPTSSGYEAYLQLFKKALPPQALEPLSSLVPWLNEHWRTLDIEGWRTGAERTADRAGLLLCGDLGAAVRVIHGGRGMAAGKAVLDLVRWSVSEGHLGLREMLGVAVTAAS